MDSFDVSVWIEIINTTGFPIAVSGALFWIVGTMLKSIKQTLEDLNKTIQNNTEVIQEMRTDLKGGNENV